jgi:hypothetical protein
LTWTDEATTEEGYYVNRSGTLIATLPSGSWSYSDTGASGDTTYTYTVRAYFGSVTSLAATVSVTTPACVTPVVAPTPVSPANGVTFDEGTAVTLSWSGDGDDYYGEVWGGPMAPSPLGGKRPHRTISGSSLPATPTPGTFAPAMLRARAIGAAFAPSLCVSRLPLA